MIEAMYDVERCHLRSVRFRRSSFITSAWFIALCWIHVSLAFREGEVIPTALRAKLDETETAWEDLLAKGCSRFKRDTRVYVPIPRPLHPRKSEELQEGILHKMLRGRKKEGGDGWDPVHRKGGRLRLAFAFQSGTVSTSWTSIIVPEQEASIVIRHKDGKLMGAEVKAVQASMLSGNRDHVMVHYQWIEEKELDDMRGMLWMTSVALVLSSLLLIRIVKVALAREELVGQSSTSKVE